MATTPETTEQFAGLSNEQLINMYRQMVLIRVFEERCQEMYTRAKIGGFLHLYVGQEAVAVGMCAALRPEDHIITHYRDHGHAIARGLDTNALIRCRGRVLGTYRLRRASELLLHRCATADVK